ncbi:hypothetical protein CES85_3293 (plasmid) [Ochrobactrum quorumnocens]|uniref:Uncharacterized protein n=1 Tax=Ochrobactrum quorumnocens TaxID=271865 RepID=A0A248UN54_9HYPH|nr:hypothetical protein CES85_3293 [[Ochrobactrum] quorumnocens]
MEDCFGSFHNIKLLLRSAVYKNLMSVAVIGNFVSLGSNADAMLGPM